jgi:cytochrome d ubiquinol oxidase subunit I
MVLSPWALTQYAHTMCGALVTGAFSMASLGAFYVLSRKQVEYGALFLKLGVVVACLASMAQIVPTGDWQGKMIAKHQPVTLAAMEGLFKTEKGAGMVIIGQPNVENGTLDNPIVVPGVLSFLTYERWGAEVKGLDAFPRDQWPDNIPLLYYSYHIMVGLGTIFVAIMVLAVFLLLRRRLTTTPAMLWVLMLSFPFPFIANTAGWITAEVGRQPWLVYGLMRTENGFSHHVSSGNGLFTLIGFMGIYMVMGILFLFLMQHEIEHGPHTLEAAAPLGASDASPTAPATEE